MIVRILGEGQFRLPDSSLDEINTLDAAVESALAAGTDEAAFRSALEALLARVREVGAPLEADALESSDVVLPYAEASPAEVRDLLTEEGLIPG
jgi:hypothetical protein